MGKKGTLLNAKDSKETVGESLKGDWGRSPLITGGIIGGHYCIVRVKNEFVSTVSTAVHLK